MNKKLIERIAELFAVKLQVRTTWGRNEVLTLYKDATNEALLELIDAQ